MQPYSAARRIIHNQAACKLAGNLLSVTTPVEQWAYAVEFPPQDGAPVPEEDMKLILRARVYEGAIGLGLLTPQRTEYQREVEVVANGKSELVEIPLRQGAVLGALMLRNTSVNGRSKVDVDVLGCEISSLKIPYNSAGRMKLAPPNLIGYPAFRGLKPEKKVLTPGGFTYSAIGQKIALHFDQTWSHPQEWKEEHVEHNNFPWSWLHEEIFEWIALAESVRAARRKFTMIELGAGYGRWIVAGAMLARRLKPGLPIKLVGVEAEPMHFAWMRQHFTDNDLDPALHELVEAAVAAESGTTYFCGADDPSLDYGQHVYSTGADFDTSRLSPRPVPAVGINDLLAGHDCVDLVDIDIQGYERVIVPAGIDEMNKRVRRIYIGIHEPMEIATELTEIFTRNGWRNIVSFPFKSEVETEYGRISFTDGCQDWLNPRLE